MRSVTFNVFGVVGLVCIMLLSACASRNEYTLPDNVATAQLVVVDKITFGEAMKARAASNPVDALFKLVDTVNTIIPDQRAALDAVDGLAVPSQDGHYTVEAGVRRLTVVANASGDVRYGQLQYALEPNRHYQLAIRLHDSSRLDTRASQGRFQAQLTATNAPEVVLEETYF